MSALSPIACRGIAFVIAMSSISFLSVSATFADQCAELVATYAEARQKLQAAQEVLSRHNTAADAYLRAFQEQMMHHVRTQRNVQTHIEENINKRALIERLKGPDWAQQIRDTDAELTRLREIERRLRVLMEDVDSASTEKMGEYDPLIRGAEARRDMAADEVAAIRNQMGRGFGGESCFRTPRQQRPAPAEPGSVAVLPRDTLQDSLRDAGIPVSVPPIASTATCAEARSALAQHQQAVQTARSSNNYEQYRGAVANMHTAMATTETICDREVRPPVDVFLPQPAPGLDTDFASPAEPEPVYQPPGGRAKTTHPPRRVQPRTPPAGQTRTPRWPNVDLPRLPPSPFR